MSSAVKPRSFQEVLAPWIQLTRVKKFAGTMFLFWPWAWSLTVTARAVDLPVPIFLSYLVQGFFAASLLHSAGCIWNDILDRDFDRQVARTKKRPVASGAVSVPGAVAFMFAHLSILVQMIWYTNTAAWNFGLVSIFFLPGVYPLMKRITYWPQAWLGLAMNCGAPAAALVLTGRLPLSIWCLSVGTWAWTLWYDTIYAHQDKADDIKAGVKSTAVLFGDNTKPILAAFGTLFLGCLAACGVLAGAGALYFICSVGGAAILLAKELYEVDLDDPKSCWQTFHRNGFTFGALVWAGTAADYLIRA